MKMINHQPATVHKPFSAYALATEVQDATRWLHISGQVGADSDGNPVEGIEGQLEAIFFKLGEILKEAGMDRTNLVKITIFLTRAEDAGVMRKVRDRFMAGHLCASSLLIVAGLSSPNWLAEVEAVAAA
ncbi:MAG TPA: RidA family protein [Rhodospirillaceae bacterium]|nr:RidA family protein [Rhodospirillaceae bacterium]